MVPELPMSCLPELYASPCTKPDNSSLNLQMLFCFNVVVKRANFKCSVSIFEPKYFMCFSSVPWVSRALSTCKKNQKMLFDTDTSCQWLDCLYRCTIKYHKASCTGFLRMKLGCSKYVEDNIVELNHWWKKYAFCLYFLRMLCHDSLNRKHKVCFVHRVLNFITCLMLPKRTNVL